ncbi:MAG TPA: DUF4142 domain-containing protein [Polyangium sp.]|nr:DUF4142 domain-containing protein [Polyangium sp.]
MVCKIRRLTARVALVGAVACLGLIGCGADDQAVGGPNNPPPRVEAMSTGQITAVLDSFDQAETKQAEAVLERLEDDVVRAYAQKILTEHEVAAMELDALTRKLGTKSESSPMKTEVEKLAEKVQRTITQESVAQLPATFLDGQIQMHKKALTVTDKMMDATQATELRSYIDNYRVTLKQHLDQAQELRKRFPETER